GMQYFVTRLDDRVSSFMRLDNQLEQCSDALEKAKNVVGESVEQERQKIDKSKQQQARIFETMENGKRVFSDKQPIDTPHFEIEINNTFNGQVTRNFVDSQVEVKMENERG